MRSALIMCSFAKQIVTQLKTLPTSLLAWLRADLLGHKLPRPAFGKETGYSTS